MNLGTVKRIVLHYSATYPDQDLDVSDIDAMHRARGFSGVGYHFVIKRDGTVQKGRPESQLGAHVLNHNTGSIGICTIGGLDRKTGPNVGVDNRTPEQIAAQLKLIRDLLTRHPDAEVLGHRDLGATQCPGFDVRAWWAAQSVSAPLGAVPTPPAAHSVESRLAALEARMAALEAKP